MEQVKHASHIHVTGYAGSVNHDSYSRFLKRVKEETDATVLFDVGSGFHWRMETEEYELFPYIDVLFMNETESVHYSRQRDSAGSCPGFCKVLWSGGNGAWENRVPWR